MEVIGKIKVIDETKTVGTAGFKKRELVVTTEEQYPQHILIEFVQDRCELLNNYNIGESVRVFINLRGREWVNPQGETKYFNAIQGWKIEKIQAEVPSQQIPSIPASDAFEPTSNFKEEDHDDLPF